MDIWQRILFITFNIPPTNWSTAGRWFIMFIDERAIINLNFDNQKPIGHAFERALILRSILLDRENIYLGNVLNHFQINSHETKDFKKDKSVFYRLLGEN